MTYDEALAYLSGVTNFERTHAPKAMRAIKLERMRVLCDRLGNPQRRFRSMLVAGTNGKGSICAMVYEILRAAKKRVGLYTSPHLEDLRERVRVSLAASDQHAFDQRADWISQTDLAEALTRVAPVVDVLHDVFSDGPPTYFEILTAAAFVHFAKRGIEVAVLEVGLGGRLDATNVADPVVSVIGPIGMDHMDVLGDDLVSIAREKAGVIRPQGVVISAVQQPPVSVLLRSLADERGARLVEYGQQISAEVVAHGPTKMRLLVQGLRARYEDLTLPLAGRHQAHNAAIAIAAVELLADSGAPYSAVKAGLERLDWPGRIQLVRQHTQTVFDGAHNPPAAEALRATVEECWPDRPKHLVLGMSGDKPIDEVCQILAPMAASITCTKSQHPRACDPQRLADTLARMSDRKDKITVIADPVDAYTYVLNTAAADDVLIVTGSLFLVGELRAALRRVKPRAAKEGRAKRLASSAAGA